MKVYESHKTGRNPHPSFLRIASADNGKILNVWVLLTALFGVLLTPLHLLALACQTAGSASRNYTIRRLEKWGTVLADRVLNWPCSESEGGIFQRIRGVDSARFWALLPVLFIMQGLGQSTSVPPPPATTGGIPGPPHVQFYGEVYGWTKEKGWDGETWYICQGEHPSHAINPEVRVCWGRGHRFFDYHMINSYRYDFKEPWSGGKIEVSCSSTDYLYNKNDMIAENKRSISLSIDYLFPGNEKSFENSRKKIYQYYKDELTQKFNVVLDYGDKTAVMPRPYIAHSLGNSYAGAGTEYSGFWYNLFNKPFKQYTKYDLKLAVNDYTAYRVSSKQNAINPFTIYIDVHNPDYSGTFWRDAYVNLSPNEVAYFNIYNSDDNAYDTLSEVEILNTIYLGTDRISVDSNKVNKLFPYKIGVNVGFLEIQPRE